MGTNYEGRLTRLARSYRAAYGGWTAAAGDDDEYTRLTEVYDGFRALPPLLGQTWPAGTAEALMRALVRDQTHTFTAYDGEGNRTVTRIGPFYRDAYSGRIAWPDAEDMEHAVHCFPYRWDRVDYSPSYVAGMPSYMIATRLPDGSWWDAREQRRPTPRKLRQLVVERARRAGELDLLDAALRQWAGQDDGWQGWLADATDVVQSP